MKYTRAIINGEVIAGEEISRVHFPKPQNPYWEIRLKNGIVIYATGQVSVWTRDES